MSSQRTQIWALFCLLVVLGFISGSIFLNILPNGWPLRNTFLRFRTHLGLDLQGGAHLIYEADTSQVTKEEADSAISGVRDVIERRVNALGVSEPVVQTARVGDKLRVIVELAGVFDVDQAIAQIGETPLLEFRTEASAPEPVALSDEERMQREGYNAAQLLKAQQTIVQLQAENGENFAELATELSEDPGSAEEGGDLGFISRQDVVKEFGDELFDQLAQNQISSAPVQTVFGYHIVQRLESTEEENPNTGETEILAHARHILFRTQSLEGEVPQYDPWAQTALGGGQLQKSELIFDTISGSPQVSLLFDDEGSTLFEEITDANVGRRVAIFLDGSIISAPVVQQKITGGRATITGNFTIPEARALVERLNAGALPIPITLVSQQTVGPTLGAVSIEKSTSAGLWGFLFVAVFMLAVYRLSGVLSIVALAFYASIVFALFKLIPVTLTLAGIAGFLLSVGMAVDANVLIFERLREELRAGKEFNQAIKEAFERAWNSIRDSNVSTLITCLILSWFGTSVVKGFAITLAIGILVSMFSAIIITRTFMELVSRINFLRNKKALWGG